ncbi:MAG: hypothetical protein JOY81_13510 [Alphaproteobacteria bacterium]|nr:hypothetical protein [Alphaproteobacteria bacterium]
MPVLSRRAMFLGTTSLIVSTGEAAARSGVVAAVAQTSGTPPYQSSVSAK